MECARTSGSDLAGANGPDGFIGNDDFRPAILADDLVHSSKLLGHNIDGGALLSLLQRLAAAQNDTDATIKGDLGLACNKVVSLLEDGATLAVTQDSPGNVAVLQLLN